MSEAKQVISMPSSSSSCGESISPMNSKTRIKRRARKSTGKRELSKTEIISRLKVSTLSDLNKLYKLMDAENSQLHDYMYDLNEENEALRNDKMLLNRDIEEKEEELKALKAELEESQSLNKANESKLEIYQHEIVNLVKSIDYAKINFEQGYNDFVKNIVERYNIAESNDENNNQWIQW